MEKVIIEIVLSGSGIIAPEQLPHLLAKVGETVPPGGSEVVIVSGRLPVWAFAALTHFYHPRPAVATFEPRLAKGVVVATHTATLKVGDLIDLSDAKKLTITFP